MAKEYQQLPDTFWDDADEIDFHAPDKKVVDLRQEVEVLTGTVIKRNHVGISFDETQGAPQRMAIGMGSTRTNVIESGHVEKIGFGRRFLNMFSEPSGHAISDQSGSSAPRIQNRGQIVDASYEPVAPRQAALAAPQPHGSQQMLPAPQRASGALQIEHRPSASVEVPVRANKFGYTPRG